MNKWDSFTQQLLTTELLDSIRQVQIIFMENDLSIGDEYFQILDEDSRTKMLASVNKVYILDMIYPILRDGQTLSERLTSENSHYKRKILTQSLNCIEKQIVKCLVKATKNLF